MTEPALTPPGGAGAPPGGVKTEVRVGRRMILGLSAMGVVGTIFGAGVQDRLAALLAPLQAADRTGLAGLFPIAGRFRIYSVVGFLPKRTTAEYRLDVGGLVERPHTYTYDELRALPRHRLVRDFQCVTGWRVDDVAWTGVRLADLLAAAGVRDGAAAVTLRSFDEVYTESLTLEQARRDDVMVVYAMQDKAITRAHGGPVRLFVGPMYGYKSLKWLSAIEVVPEVEPGYWEVRGYDIDAWVGRSNGRDDEPT